MHVRGTLSTRHIWTVRTVLPVPRILRHKEWGLCLCHNRCCCAYPLAEAVCAGVQSKRNAPARYFEVDFAEVTAKKAAIMHGAPDIAGLLPPDAVVESGEGQEG